MKLASLLTYFLSFAPTLLPFFPTTTFVYTCNSGISIQFWRKYSDFEFKLECI